MSSNNRFTLDSDPLQDPKASIDRKTGHLDKHSHGAQHDENDPKKVYRATRLPLCNGRSESVENMSWGRSCRRLSRKRGRSGCNMPTFFRPCPGSVMFDRSHESFDHRPFRLIDVSAPSRRRIGLTAPGLAAERNVAEITEVPDTRSEMCDSGG